MAGDTGPSIVAVPKGHLERKTDRVGNSTGAEANRRVQAALIQFVFNILLAGIDKCR